MTLIGYQCDHLLSFETNNAGSLSLYLRPLMLVYTIEINFMSLYQMLP